MASTSTKTPNPTIKLKGKNAKAFDRLVSADSILKVVNKDQATRKAGVLELLKALFVKLRIEAGAKQENPRVTTVKSNANLQVKHITHIEANLELDGKRTSISLSERLDAAGFTGEVVTEIMAAAVELHTETCVKSFEEMAASSDVSQREIGQKIQAYVARFTEENQAAMVQTVSWETVRPCWKDFSVALAVRLAEGDLDRGIEILGRLWAVLPVQYVIDQMEFGGDKAAAFGELLKG